MLAPETVDFLPPQFTEKKAKLSNLRDCIGGNGEYRFHKDDCHEAVEVTNMKIVLPGLLRLPDELRDPLECDAIFYKATELDLFSCLFSKDFVKLFVAQGRLFLKSEVDDHTRDDGLMLLPNGRLIISTDFPMSQRLGLEGFKVHKIAKERVLAILNINSILETSEKVIKRWKANLLQFQARLSPPFTFTWRPFDASICPSTLAKFFTDCGATVETEEPSIELKRTEVFSNQVPFFGDFDDDSAIYDERDYDLESIEDWVGGLLSGVSRSSLDELTQRASIDEVDGINTGKQPVLIAEIEGLYLADSFSDVIMAVEKWVQSKANNIPWAIVTLKSSWPKLFLLQAKKKVKMLGYCSRTCLVAPKFSICRSKRG